MNQLVMFRVPKGRVLDRTAYEYFGGLMPKGGATWVRDINARAVVHTFPRGWVNSPTKGIVQSWVPSVVYVAPLGLYLMASSGIGCMNAECNWFYQPKPSYLGVWSARNPWGPWTQIHEETAWTPGNDPAARCYSPQISPTWIAPDGKSFWLAWSDFQGWRQFAEESKRREKRTRNMSEDEKRKMEARLARQYMPYYSLNAQRFDLVVA